MELSKLLSSIVQNSSSAGSQERKGDTRRPWVTQDQCAYCKEKGHWVKDCPKRPRNRCTDAALGNQPNSSP